MEVIYHTVKYGEFSNRGFVGGPVCTIYGVGFAGVAYLLEPFRGSVFVLFPASVVLATLLEFVTGWVLEKVFHEKWWDYTDEPFNVKGYICLRFSLLWGLACTGTLMIIHPLVEKAYAAIPAKVCIVLLSVVAVVYLIDWGVTVIEIRKIRIRLGIAKSIADWMDDVSVFLGSGLHEGTLEVMEKGEEGKEFIAEQREAWTEKKSELTEIMQETKEVEEKLREKAKDLETRIEPRLLTSFKRIRKNARNGLGIVYVQRDACGGCFNKIPPQRQLDIKMHKKIIVCEYCGRIMIDPELAGVKPVADPAVETKKPRRTSSRAKKTPKAEE